MQYAKCAICKEEMPVRNMHYVNYLHAYVCNKCYTDEIRKEEDYYDFCSAMEYRYSGKVEEKEESLDDEKFFKE